VKKTQIELIEVCFMHLTWSSVSVKKTHEFAPCKQCRPNFCDWSIFDVLQNTVQ